MARIRSLKPEFLSDEKLAPLDVCTRFVFVGLICLADDCGRLLDNIKLIDASIFPETDDSARESLAKLSRTGRIVRGKTASGQKVIQILNWSKHQKVDHPNVKSALPQIVGCNEDTDIREPLANESRTSREEPPNDSRTISGPTTNDQGPGTGEREGGDPPLSAGADPPAEKPVKRNLPPLPGPTPEQFVDEWNAAVPLNRIRTLGKGRLKALTQRRRDPFWVENYAAALLKIRESPFLCGENERGWTATPEWFLRPDSVLKTIENHYARGSPKGLFDAELSAAAGAAMVERERKEMAEFEARQNGVAAHGKG